MNRKRWSLSGVDVFLICILIWGQLLSFAIFWLPYSGVVSHSLPYCFDVDSEGNIYVGTLERINVYKDGAYIRTIRPPTSKEYNFYIKNDVIYINCKADGQVVACDTEGNELDVELPSHYDPVELFSQKTKAKNGHFYQASDNMGLGPYKIMRDGAEVFRVSMLDYMCNGLPFMVSFVIFLVCLVFAVLLKLSDITSKPPSGPVDPIPR